MRPFRETPLPASHWVFWRPGCPESQTQHFLEGRVPRTEGTFRKRIPLEASQLLRAKPAIRVSCHQEAVVLTRGLAAVFNQKPAEHVLCFPNALRALAWMETRRALCRDWTKQTGS